jgi:hypothetical protein
MVVKRKSDFIDRAQKSICRPSLIQMYGQFIGLFVSRVFINRVLTPVLEVVKRPRMVCFDLILLFATCCSADALIDRSYTAEAKRLLVEASLLQPKASFIQDRLKMLR